MLIDKSNIGEFAEKLVNDFSIRDSSGNNKIHLESCSMFMATEIFKEIATKHLTDSTNVSINVDIEGGSLYLYDGVDEYFCRSLMTWSFGK